MEINFKKIILILLITLLNQKSYSKPLPPGSGEGDVPANILILLDSSVSMRSALPGATVLGKIHGLNYDDSGNIYATQHDDWGGVIRFTSAGEIDNTFNNELGSWTGSAANTTEVCNVTFKNDTFSFGNDHNTTIYRPAALQMGENVTYSDGTTMSEVLFVRSSDKNDTLVGFNPDDGTCKYYIDFDADGGMRDFDIVELNGTTHLLTTVKKGKNYEAVSLNLTDREFHRKTITGKGPIKMANSWYNSLNSDLTRWYFPFKGTLFWFTLEEITKNGNTLYTVDSNNFVKNVRNRCVKNQNSLSKVRNVEVSPDKSGNGNDIVITNSDSDLFQKFEITHGSSYTSDDDTCTHLGTAGAYGTASNKGSASGSISADNIFLKNPVGLHVTTNRILIGDQTGKINEINEDLFTTANKDTAWLQEMGSEPSSRWDGAKLAIKSILSDTSLTSGAHFGFGHWNAGHAGTSKWTEPYGGRDCHRNSGTQCTYYGTWSGVHPDGQSSECSNNSCLLVGISAEGYAQVKDKIDDITMEWGTDARAFAQIAKKYFIDEKDITNVMDPNSPCQLNYVIVIGDGEWSHHADAEPLIENLRENGVVSLFIGYGGGISNRGQTNFRNMAVTGSCDKAGDADCQAALFPPDAATLKSDLEDKIRQILAEKLAFTAPSITATIQEGGSLYQAQFAYEQYGEWQGTILRKTLNPDGSVDHDMSTPGNWDASAEVQEQAGGGAGANRNIWSAIDGVDYIGGEYAWNNFHTNYQADIQIALESLDYTISDYYTSSTTCGEQDEVAGLILYMRGDDFFNYQGDCNKIDKTRPHVLGDIYHSQLIEIGGPDGNIDFTDTNEEAYWRAINDYQNYKQTYADRKSVLYAGSNSGMLHAINAETGEEEWGFIPPPMIGLLPKVINKDLNGKVNGNAGGTNAMFGVDGSPVVHDVFIKGLGLDGEWEATKNWHSILFIPYGRGGAGFSVLDVTNTVIKNNQGPMHMFSIYNDSVNNRVLHYNHEGIVRTYPYSSSTISSSQSLEAKQARRKEKKAEDDDLLIDANGDDYTNRDPIATCQTNADAASGKFRINGTNACYKGTTFTFNNPGVPTIDGTNIAENTLVIHELNYTTGNRDEIKGWTAKIEDGKLVVTFAETKYVNESGSSLRDSNQTSKFTIRTSCSAASGIDPKYNYSQLGETWSAPKIFRIPSEDVNLRSNLSEDRYVAVMGGGMGSTDVCAGSVVFLVDLENNGEIYGAETNGGPITIVDTTPDGVTLADGSVEPTPHGSNIANALPTPAIVITPDTAPGIPWRGAMVYFNDLEGKITKINLSSSTKNGAELFDQTTLFNLEANTRNSRYSYFGMDAGIGQDTNHFWLFGGTGNFSNLGGVQTGMDNILYGVKDPDFPFFKHLNGVIVPRESDGSFLRKAHKGANNANRILNSCLDKTGETVGNCPTNADAGWAIHLDTADDMKFRKMSGAPKLFKGQVYYPVYQPPEGANKCNVGDAYICSAEDECGNNTSNQLDKADGADYGKKCSYIRQGILSEIVVFGDQLFANVAGPSEDEDTLFQTYAIKGEASSNKSNWRELSN